MSARARASAWYCASGCYRTPHQTRKACRYCCGYTADHSKHFQGSTAAVTKN